MRHMFAACLLPVLVAVATASAQVPPPTDARVVVAEARKALAQRYVLPDVAAKLAAALARAEAAGRYRGLTGEALAERMNADLRAVARDKHLSISHAPQLAAQLREHGDGDDHGLPAGYAREVTLSNAGVRKLERLPGNIRYLAYDGFVWGTPEAEQALVTAMQFLKGADAIILDLRANGGGWPQAVAALASYFVPAGTPLVRFEMRGAPGEASTAPQAPFSLVGKPLYVLTSGGTASAAEEFASHVSAFGFGTLVGAPSAGAAYRNDLVPLPGGFVLSVSVGRPVHAKTGGDWEGKGVAPAIVVAPDEALLRAQVEAMAAIGARSPSAERAAAARLLTYYRALAAPVAPAQPLASYAGRYGEWTIGAGPNGLTSKYGDRAPTRLVPIAPDRFALEVAPASHFRFVTENDAVTALEVDDSDGDPSRLAREAAM